MNSIKQIMNSFFVKLALIQLASLVAPIVTLFYRKGIWLTPDDPVSPFGCGTTPGSSIEPRMQWIYAKFGKFIGDWYWLGIRNTAYGLSYKWKPELLKLREGWLYRDLKMDKWEHGNTRVIRLFGPDETYVETVKTYKFFHVIYGYRLGPVYGTMIHDIPVRRNNMDGRPILSIRWGAKDD